MSTSSVRTEACFRRCHMPPQGAPRVEPSPTGLFIRSHWLLAPAGHTAQAVTRAQLYLWRLGSDDDPSDPTGCFLSHGERYAIAPRWGPGLHRCWAVLGRCSGAFGPLEVGFPIGFCMFLFGWCSSRRAEIPEILIYCKS